MNVGQWIVIGLSVFVGVWYAAGHYFNRSRGERTYEWLRAGLKPWGKFSAIQQRGSLASGARIEIAQAAAPFRRMEVVFLLEPRENLPLWFFKHLQGERDEVVLKARLRNSPQAEIVAAPSQDRDIKGFLAAGQVNAYEQVPGPDGFILLQRGQMDREFIERLGQFLERYRGVFPRIAVQPGEPHLVLRAYLSPLQSISADEYFQAVSQLVA